MPAKYLPRHSLQLPLVHSSSRIPIDVRRRSRCIPISLCEDRASIALITQRRNLLLRFAYLNKRVPSLHPHRGEKERARTVERRDILERLRLIERELILWIAEVTHHPEIWTSPYTPQDVDPLDARAFSVRESKVRSWRLSKRRPGPQHPKRKEVARIRTIARHRLADEIQELDFAWLSALTFRVFPHDPLPPRCVIHPRLFTP